MAWWFGQINEFLGVFCVSFQLSTLFRFDAKERCDAQKVVSKDHFIVIEKTMQRRGISFSFQVLRKVFNFRFLFRHFSFATIGFIVPFDNAVYATAGGNDNGGSSSMLYMFGGVLAFATRTRYRLVIFLRLFV